MKKILILSFVVLITSNVYAQNNFNLEQFDNESINFLEQPAKWKGNDWLKFGLISAGTILLTQTDQSFRDAILKDQSYIGTVPEQVGRFWGRGYATILFAGAFGLHGLIDNNYTSKKIGFEIVQATLYAGAITQFVKMTIGRARPYTNEGSSSFHPFVLFKDDYNSFPSGDVTLAFSLSSVLSKNLKSDLLKILAYIPAVLTMTSRMYRDMHWSSDVFFAAAVGYFIGNWVVNLHENNDTNLTTAFFSPLVIQIKL